METKPGVPYDIIPYGEQALLIRFEEKIDAAINQKVHQLDAYIKKNRLKGLLYTIPAYCSLTLVFDVGIFQKERTIDKIKAFIPNVSDNASQLKSRRLKIPVCYESDFALDQDFITQTLQMSWEDVIRMHSQNVYQVYLLGFLPGFAYLGSLPEALRMPRKAVIRQKVPKGSVAIAGLQTGIYPDSVPGGWQIIGACPIPAFAPQQDPPFLFQSGDMVSFEPIDMEKHLDIEAKIAAGTLHPNSWICNE